MSQYVLRTFRTHGIDPNYVGTAYFGTSVPVVVAESHDSGLLIVDIREGCSGGAGNIPVVPRPEAPVV